MQSDAFSWMGQTKRLRASGETEKRAGTLAVPAARAPKPRMLSLDIRLRQVLSQSREAAKMRSAKERSVAVPNKSESARRPHRQKRAKTPTPQQSRVRSGTKREVRREAVTWKPEVPCANPGRQRSSGHPSADAKFEPKFFLHAVQTHEAALAHNAIRILAVELQQANDCVLDTRVAFFPLCFRSAGRGA